MKLNINLEEDAELRKEVRKLIEGQVTSILRDEVKTLVMDVMSSGGKKLTAEHLEKVATSEVKSHVSKFIHTTEWRADYTNLEKIIRNAVVEAVKQKDAYIKETIEKYVATIQGETLNNLIGKSVEKEVKNVLSKLLKDGQDG